MANSYTHVSNTTVSGPALVASLKGDDVRALEFAASLTRPPPRVITGAQTLTPNEWVEASINSFGVTSISGVNTVSLGPDTRDNALYYIELFNIKNTLLTDRRMLRFYLFTAIPNTADIYLGTSSATTNFINVSVDGQNFINTHLLFAGNADPGGDMAGKDGAGYERIVLLSAVDLTPGAEKLNFNILSRSL